MSAVTPVSSSLPPIAESRIFIPVIRGDPTSPEMTLQILSCRPATTDSVSDNEKKKRPLLFLHGSFHSAWCYSERYLPYFASHGYDSYAYSFRGTGPSPVLGPDGKIDGSITKVKIDEHVDDLASILETFDRRPVVVAHSFGGAVLMKYMEGRHRDGTGPEPSGIALLCSVPPSGNGKMTRRFLRRSLVASYRITVGFVAKKLTSDADLCRTLFFDGSVPPEDLTMYMGLYARDSSVTIDVVDFAKNKLPSLCADERGVAPWAMNAALPPPRLVLGANKDYVVDKEGVEETGKFLDTDAVWVNSPHDVMLGGKWEEGARAIRSWLEGGTDSCITPDDF
eukprot:CAMPEP_0194283332 /NCGR_PEP_ID=MMETSP0169-20130528/25145_1 /TAXON_ID=218684 /ORGANISM="Corethron pennatum, Strain L29A3" /LENGTH=337 /DNA_ID=CAMNT_0039028905 /DNA_START=211 /DNA_END=1224 /DNA_ORIENTATION=-